MRRLGVRFVEADASWTAERVVSGFVGRPGLYVHVPFCETLCPFCPYDKVRYEPDVARGYLACLRTEADRYLAAMAGPFTSLYVGGGTPTLCLEDLDWLRDRLLVEGERAIEVLPSHMTRVTAERLRRLGFDAVSVGVQSFHEPVLRHLRRPTTVDVNRRAVACARDRFACVDVDLIFDVAYDDPDTLLRDLKEAFSFEVDQVSTYPLMRFGYTPFGKAEHDARAEHVLLARATELAEAEGYHRAAVWSFVRDGGRTYTSITRPYVLGLGASAATFTGQVFLVNRFGIRRYASAVDAVALPIARVANLTPAQAALYRAFWQTYTGALPLNGDDPLLRHPAVKVLASVARTAGWLRGRGTLGLTTSGYDRFHDLERWVTYRLIEPLWAALMSEDDVQVGARPAPTAGSARSSLGG